MQLSLADIQKGKGPQRKRAKAIQGIDRIRKEEISGKGQEKQRGKESHTQQIQRDLELQTMVSQIQGMGEED